MLTRRAVLRGTIAATLARPLSSAAQPAQTPPRIGYLTIGSFTANETRAALEAFRRGLRERGYVEGQNLIIEYRAADGSVERLDALARELVRLDLDLLVAGSTPGARAALKATATIPIVAPAMGDPVGDGLVTSLARPGGNLTGSTFLGPDLVGKRLELLKESVPAVSRVAVLWHPAAFADGTMREMLNETETVARTLGLRLHFAAVARADDLERAFAGMSKENVGALFVFPSVLLYLERQRIVTLAAHHRLPAAVNNREAVELGALVGYGVSIPDLVRRAATYVEKILKGARPGDLPIEGPTTFELVVNLRTARALGITIPPSVLLRADHLIE